MLHMGRSDETRRSNAGIGGIMAKKIKCDRCKENPDMIRCTYKHPYHAGYFYERRKCEEERKRQLSEAENSKGGSRK